MVLSMCPPSAQLFILPPSVLLILQPLNHSLQPSTAITCAPNYVSSVLVVQADVLRDAALAGNTNASSFLCDSYHNATVIHDPDSKGFVSLDLRGAIYIAVVAQPSGCVMQQGGAFSHSNVPAMPRDNVMQISTVNFKSISTYLVTSTVEVLRYGDFSMAVY